MEESTEEHTEHSTGTKKIRAPIIALAIAGVVLGGSLIAGIGSFAFAQEATGTPTAQEQATPEATDAAAPDATEEATPDATDDGSTTDDGTTAGEHECDKDKERSGDSADTSASTSSLTF